MTALILLLVVAGSYLAAHVAFDWIARRFRIVSGAEYLVLGILLGPQASGLLTADTLEALSPLITLGLGWSGAHLGSQFVLAVLVRIRGVVYRVAFVESLLTIVLVTATQVFVLAWTFGFHAREAIVPALALGAMATVSAEAGIAVAVRGRGPRDPLVRQFQVAVAMNALVAVAAFGLLTALVHAPPVGIDRVPTTTEWVVINLAVGAVGGALFHLFVGEERKPDRLTIALVGAVILVSGAAAYLLLSPILTAMVFGMILTNTFRRPKDLQATLARVDKALYFVMLILAGAWWAPSQRDWVAPVLLFLATRAVAKLGGARLSARANGRLAELGLHWGRGLLGQGGLALLIGLNYLQLPNLPLRNLVFTAVVASVLLTDLLSARFAESVFRPEARLLPERAWPRRRGSEPAAPPAPDGAD